jgi:hypothetical protein
MRTDNQIQQLNLALSKLAIQGVSKNDPLYKEIRAKLDELQEAKNKNKINNTNIQTTKELIKQEDKALRIPEIDASKIITKDEDIYYFKNGIMIPEKIVKRLIDESQGKSPYFVLASLCKFANNKGVVSNRRVEDLANLCGYEDSSTYRFGLNWLEDNEFVVVDRSTRPNTYLINDYKFGRAIIVPEEDIREQVKTVIPKELRVKWTYYLRNQHSPANKKGKFDLSLNYLKKMTNAVSFKEVLCLVDSLKDNFFSTCELIKSTTKKAKNKLKVEFNNLGLGIIKDLQEEINRVNHSEYFERVYKSFTNLDIPLTLPNFRRAYQSIKEVGEFYLDRVLAKARTGQYKSDKQSVGYFIYLIEREYSFLNS